MSVWSRAFREFIRPVSFFFNCRYKVDVAGKSLPVLTNLDKGKYGVIVFENLNKYLQMDKWNRELLDKYCREYSVGIIGFIPPSEESLVGAQLKGFPLFIHTNLKLKVRSPAPPPSYPLGRGGRSSPRVKCDSRVCCRTRL